MFVQLTMHNDKGKGS